MATFGATIRRGLPRRPGGDPWPPAADAPGGDVPVEAPAYGSLSEEPAASRSLSEERSDETNRVPAPVAAGSRPLRRGLPRVAGGEPWPPADAAGPATAESPVAPSPGAASPGSGSPGAASPGAASLAAGIAATAASPSPRRQSPSPAPAHATVDAAASGPASAQTSAPEQDPAAEDAGRPVRRGLPRVAGGEPWPPPGLFAVASAPASAAAPAAASAPPPAEPETDTFPRESPSERSVSQESGPLALAGTGAEPAGEPGPDYSIPLPFTRTVWPGAAARTRPEPRPEPKRIGPFTRLQWAGAVIVGGAALLIAAVMAVFAVRVVLSTEWGADFLAAYPGEYHLPEGAPVGFPAWLGWQHFFNVFLMVLIIRTGLQVRTEKRPSVFWSPRGNNKRKISLNLWFHQSLDILWIVNGVIFVVLLFVTGQWMRIVPTSWEVFPNALSAALQYVSLDWPTENGWVNYNSLQQLAYFATVFLAAPLAILTGVRMSGVWPKNAAGLNRAYPVEWARAVHFPVMIYFVLFIFVHVVLVFATGALRNLNHMYAASDAINWVGFWIFAVSMLVIVAAWVAARPLVLAPIARVFGKVSGR